MKMSRYFICCDQCFEGIGKKNGRAARLWMDLCTMWMNCGGTFTMKTVDFPELRLLEEQGFLVSTETPFGIAIRINGHMSCYDGQQFFCIKAGQHD